MIQIGIGFALNFTMCSATSTYVLGFFLALLICSTTFAQNPTETSLYFREMSGCQSALHGHLYVLKNGQFILNENFDGDTDHQFAVASITKQMTAYAIELLVKEHRINSQTKLKELFPEIENEFAQNISIEELLNHRSGIENVGLVATANGFPANNEFCDQFVSKDFPRGTHLDRKKAFNYSNANYCILSKVIERATGVPYAEYLKERVFRPLGMNQSYVATEDEGLVGEQKIRPCQEGAVKVQSEGHKIRGGGDVISTPHDLLKWMEHLAQVSLTDHLRLEGIERVLREGSSPEIIRPAYSSQTFLPYIYEKGLRYSLFNDRLEISHEGFTTGFATALIYYPASHLSVIYLTSRPSSGSLTENLRRIIEPWLNDHIGDSAKRDL